MATSTKKSVKKEVAFDFKTIKSFEDACAKLGLDPKNLPDVSNISEEFRKAILANYKLSIIYKAINNGWKLVWGNNSNYKYYPWFQVSSSGFGFSSAHCICGSAYTAVGSRLCTDTSEKALYIGSQFEDLYKDYLL
jgi:hypothetical protein